MFIKIQTNPLDQKPAVKMEHRGTTLWYDFTEYHNTSSRTVSVNIDNMFIEFNEYLDTLTLNEQDDVFDAYKTILQIFDRNQDIMLLTNQLLDQVARIFIHLDLARIREWIIFKSTIKIPANLQDQYDLDEPDDYQKRTYLRPHYIDLAAFALATRAMVPIWGNYIVRSKNQYGSQMKEYVALQLLFKTGITDCPAFIRLGEYIQSFIDDSTSSGSNKAAPILSSIGSSEMKDYLLAKTIVRRLCTGELSSSNEQTHIITNLYQFIFNGVRDLDRKYNKDFSGMIKDKKSVIKSSKGSDEQSVSVLEMYKIVQPISDGDVVALNVYTENVEHLAQSIEPSLNMDLLHHCLAHIGSLENEIILPHHIALTQWMISRVMSPRVAQSLNKGALLRCMAVGQAILWHWQMYDLAGIMTATKVINEAMLGFGYNETKTRIKPELMESLKAMTPFSYPARSKEQGKKLITPAQHAVEAFCHLISHNDWKLHCHPELMARIEGRFERSRRMMIPGDIRLKVAHLLLKINEHSYRRSA